MDAYHYINNLIALNSRDSLLNVVKFVNHKSFKEQFYLFPQEEKEEILMLCFNKFAYSYPSLYEKHFLFFENNIKISEIMSKRLVNFWSKQTINSKYEKTLDFLLSLNLTIQPQWLDGLNIYNKEDLAINYNNLEAAGAFFKFYAKFPDLNYHHYYNMSEFIMAISNYYKNNPGTLEINLSRCYSEWAKYNNSSQLTQPPLIEQVRFFALDEKTINFFNELERKKGYHQEICSLFESIKDNFYQKQLFEKLKLFLSQNNTHELIHFAMNHTQPLLLKEVLKKYPTLKKDEKIYLYCEKNLLEKQFYSDKVTKENNKKNKI